MNTNISAFFLITCCVIVFIYSKNITNSFSRFFSQYPITRLAPSSQHRAKSIYLRIGAVIICSVIVITHFIL